MRYFSRYVDYPVISDDSGLCIEALNNKPGIYSARLAKKHGSFFRAMKFILKKLDGKKNRKIISVEGRIKGNISYKILGKKGFGYDPIFIPSNKKITFGQMPKLRKIMIDHRYIAFKKLRKKIKI